VKKRAKTKKPQAGIDGLVHTMSDTALRAALGQVLRAESDEDLIPCESVFDALQRAFPATPHRVLHRMVADLVKDEVLHRWRREFDRDMACGFREREKLKRKKAPALKKINTIRLPKGVTTKQLHAAESDRIRRTRR
jgi:hypothetical protein